MTDDDNLGISHGTFLYRLLLLALVSAIMKQSSRSRHVNVNTAKWQVSRDCLALRIFL